MTRSYKTLMGLVLILTSTVVLGADHWVVLRSQISGQCWVMKATDYGGQAPLILSRQEGRKAACAAGKRLYTDDMGNSTKCNVYSSDTIAACKKEKIFLR